MDANRRYEFGRYKSGGTGGDVVLGSASTASGTYKLRGGVLNVTQGSRTIALGQGSGSFEFSGGTLKANVFNDPATFTGDLGNLVEHFECELA